MLNVTEQKFVRSFFEDFPTADLMALALNISKHNLNPTDREGALTIICQHSNCIEAVLERRKITKGYLSSYLHKNQVSITDSWDKPALIRKILELPSLKTLPIPVQNNSISAPSISSNVLHNTLSPSSNGNEVQEYYHQLSYQFSEWFYSLMNDEDHSKLGPEHFFPDSALKLGIQNVNFSDVKEVHNALDLVKLLCEIRLTYNFKFLPNLTPNAIKYNSDIHGQVMIMVGGTLHSNCNRVVGLFEQVFLLIRDPSDNNNWKIKNSQMILRSSNAAVESGSNESALSLCQ